MNTFIQDVVTQAVRNQKWYQKNANTIVAGLVLLSAILSFVLTLGLDLPPQVAAGIPVVATFIGTIVTKLTKNGVQPSTAKKLEATPTAAVDNPLAAGRSILEAELARVRGQFEDAIDYVGKHRA